MIDHGKIEKNLGLMLVMVLLAISMGGLVEIVPMFFIKGTIERGAIKCCTCHSLEYFLPTRARSGPVRFEPHSKGWSYCDSAASE